MIRRSARLLRRLASLLVAAAVVASMLAGAAAWRLAQGPVPLSELARFLERRLMADEASTRLTIGEASLAWEGFGAGIDRPIDVRVRDLRAVAADGTIVAEIPEGAISLGLRALLLGRVEPRAIELVGIRLRLVREEAGGLRVDLGTLADQAAPDDGDDDAGFAERLLADLGIRVTPLPGGGRRDLARVRIRHARLLVDDRQLGATWQVRDATLDLHRLPHSRGVSLRLDGTATAGEARLPLTLEGELSPDLSGSLSFVTGPVVPAEIAAALPGLSVLAALEAPLTARGTVRHGPNLEVVGARVALRSGDGRILLPGGGEAPLSSAAAVLNVVGASLEVEQLQLVLPGRAGPSPTLTLAGTLRREGPSWRAEGRLTIDHVAFADLPLFWPAGLAANERAWVTGNITDGSALEARFEGALLFDELTGLVEPLAFSGSARIEGATVHYLRPMPPVTGVAAEASFALDRLELRASGGAVGAVQARSATIILSGLDRAPQWADITVRIESAVPDAVALLSHPKLDLFARRGAPPSGLSGAAEIDLALRFPLLDALSVDAIEARATARLTGAGLREAVLGRSIERGRFTLQADGDGMRIEGSGALGGIESSMTYEVDFRAGPASQVIERASLRFAPQPGVAEAFGLSLAPYVTGRVGGEARLALRRDRQGSVALRLDLRQARLALPEIGWEKPAGEAAAGEATVRLAGARVAAVEEVRLEGVGFSARGRAAFAEGRPRRIEIGSLALGRSRLAGEVRPPVRDSDPWIVSLRGQTLDLSRRPRAGGSQSSPSADSSPPLSLEARFDRVRLGEAEGSEMQDVAVSLRHDGRRLQSLEARGVAGGGWSATVRRGPAGRALELRAQDAGAFLRAAGIFETMAGGQLAVTGRWEEAAPGEPLVGEATIDEFRLREAPVIGRVLQAMTLYGLIEMARGPGLSFSRLIAPFSFDGRILELREARAYGASLGFTAKGTADLETRRLAMEGTIVPAYVFNALLGQIPLIGRLFSPERGGGVFAATYRAVGSFDDPEVSVNPLAALTPGILRGLFGLFEGGAASGGASTPPDAAGTGQPGGG